MSGRQFLFVPGPTNVPDRVLRAMHVPMEDHRNPDFPNLVLPLLEDLKKVFVTKTGKTFMFPSSGTGGWEAGLVSILSPGDKVLLSRFGRFSYLWGELASHLGLSVEILEEEWGTGADPQKIADRLKADKAHEIKAVFTVHNETATGVTSDIKAVSAAIAAANHPALHFVDGISSIGSIDFRMDEWGIDVAVAGSQKGFMMPAGASFLAVSEKALALGTASGKNSRIAHSYFSLSDMLVNNAKGYFPYTPSIPLLHGLRESLNMILAEGLDTIYARHHHLASGCRAAVKAWGMRPCAQEPKWYSDTVTAIVVPSDADAVKVISQAYRRYNLVLGAGLDRLAGKVFRIGHLGDLNELMLLGALSGAEMAMRDCGLKLEPGSGVAAAQTVFAKRTTPL
ncbi:MAG: aminotransferase class V-fold PLP-dependent enzyme [Alphaproteobacteria bacterium]|nr:aminotransferase class V-fold PLP-dependent enzyme [Alphaproteobacteria bacterium]